MYCPACTTRTYWQTPRSQTARWCLRVKAPLNYTRSGRRFWNLLHLAPLRTRCGSSRFIIGVQLDVSVLDPGSTEQRLHPPPQGLGQALPQGWGAQPCGSTGAAPPHPHAGAGLQLQATAPHGGSGDACGWGAVAAVVASRQQRAVAPAYLALQQLQEECGGLRLQHLRRVRQLGGDDVGLVERVMLQGSTHTFILKSMDKLRMQERGVVARLQSEAAMLGALDHPFMASLYAVLQTDTHVHFVVEDCTASDLYTLLHSRPKGRLREAHVRFYAAEVLLALQHLQQLGLHCRDVRPENILLHSSGHVRLATFCTLVSQAEAAAEPGVLAAVPDTPAAGAASSYAAPELARSGGSHSSTATDAWGFGVLLYELLYGEPPECRASETSDGPDHTPLAFPSKPSVSPEARDLLRRLLADDPGQRLGAQGGAAQLRAHPWFGGVDWAALPDQAAPYAAGRRGASGASSAAGGWGGAALGLGLPGHACVLG